jgi:hypothetical protein
VPLRPVDAAPVAVAAVAVAVALPLQPVAAAPAAAAGGFTVGTVVAGPLSEYLMPAAAE